MRIFLALVLAGSTATAVHARPSPGHVLRVSLADDGSTSNGLSYRPAVSADGRVVAFIAAASNLVPGDTNNLPDVFVRNIATRRTVRASVSSSGEQANGGAYDSISISGDGRRVAFSSDATNLVPGDTNGVDDVFVRDLVAGTTIRASISDAGEQATGGSYQPSMSDDGSRIAFTSFATDLVVGDVNADPDVFVRDLINGATTRVSISTAGSEGNEESTDPSLSGDGTRVAFTSFASNLVPDDAGGFLDVFIHDLSDSETRRVSHNGNQSSGFSSLNTDGTVVAFQSSAWNLVAGDANGRSDVFVADLAASTIQLVSLGSDGQSNDASYSTAIDGSGRKVAFWSEATNLGGRPLAGSLHIYLRDLDARRTCAVIADTGSLPLLGASEPALSVNGAVVAFHSSSPDVDAGNTNPFGDVYVTRLACGQ